MTMRLFLVSIIKSALPFEENVAEIKRCVDYFHAYNIPVEAELGHVGNETVYEEALSEYQYTDPTKAKEFVERTGCDLTAGSRCLFFATIGSEQAKTFAMVMDKK